MPPRVFGITVRFRALGTTSEVSATSCCCAGLGNERFRFFRPDGTELPAHVDPGTLAAGPPIEHEHAHVAATAATIRWDGTRLDSDWAVAGLAQGLHSANRAPRDAANEKWPGFDPWAA
jgi:hypothetical protein